MQNPFAALGLTSEANAAQVRAAYHARVKLCHPDQERDHASQQAAQEALVRLNLAYAEAMRQANFRESNNIVVPDVKLVARQLLKKGQLDAALRILAKSLDRDAEWHGINGTILSKKGEHEAAYAAFRTALKLEPGNKQYQESALTAGVMMRKQKTFRGRVGTWAKDLVGRMLYSPLTS